MSVQVDRRRAPRYPFGAVAEVTALKSGKYLIALTRELGRLGCFVKTMTPFPEGEEVILTITHHNRGFAVSGEVAYALPAEGMGIAFGSIPASDQSVLEDWLAENTV
jgi:Tfp pilus assembly protein PilZ